MTALSLTLIFSAVFLSLIFRPERIFGPKPDPDEEPYECGTHELWHDPNNTNVCGAGCLPGCHCRPGYIMMDKGCVPEKFGDVKCKENEELKCGIYDCQTFCDIGTDPLCALNKFDCYFSYECFCKEGFIRIDDGECVPLENCPADVLLQDYEES